MDDPLLFLAVDSGGTKCDAVVADATGAVLSRGSYRQPGESGRSAPVIRAAVHAALAGLSEDGVCFDVFLTGVPQRIVRGRLVQLRATNPVARRKAFMAMGALAERQVSRLADVSETAAALAMHGLDEGIVALSGTGALDKRGTGTLTLTGNSPTYTGLTQVQAGRLVKTEIKHRPAPPPSRCRESTKKRSSGPWPWGRRPTWRATAWRR